jgi:hypothetical protein
MQKKPYGLPPLVAELDQGKVTWKSITSIDFELLGYFLSCHLIVEHYMDELLKTLYPGLNWDAAKPTFGQRIALLSDLGLPERFDCVPAIKHLNSVRNKLSHRIDYTIDEKALLPLNQYVTKASEGGLVPTAPIETLQLFVMLCCSTLAGNISRTAMDSKASRRSS